MVKWIARPDLEARVREALRRAPIVTLLGPRQCGKTTLANHITGPLRSNYFDLENPADEARLAEPMMALERLRGLVVIDEVQRAPTLFPLLRVLAEGPRSSARFLLLRQCFSRAGAGELGVAGRKSRVCGHGRLRTARSRCGGDASTVAPRRIPARVPCAQRRGKRRLAPRFCSHLLGARRAHVRRRYLGARLATAVGDAGPLSRASVERVGDRTLFRRGAHHGRRHGDVLIGALVVRELQPWFENVGKCEIKSPKLYIRDSGILHALLGAESFRALESHPKLGASWEGFVIEQILSVTGIRDPYYWGTQAGAELDLMITVKGKRVGVEVKYADAPRLTRSMRIVLNDLKLSHLYVVHPGTARYDLAARAEAIGLIELLAEIRAASAVRHTERAKPRPS